MIVIAGEMKHPMYHYPDQLLFKWKGQLNGIVAYPIDADINFTLDLITFTKIECDYIRIVVVVKKLAIYFEQFFVRAKNEMNIFQPGLLLFENVLNKRFQLCTVSQGEFKIIKKEGNLRFGRSAHIFKIRKQNHRNQGSFVIMIIRLSQLKPGQKGVIKEFKNDEIFLKLMEMGCIPGENITLEQIAPMGDPISVNVSGYRLSLRLNEAENIMVELTN